MASVPTVTRVACYARVSTEDQAERQTVDAQRDFLRRYCELHGLSVAGVYVDDGISGTVPLGDRPEGRRLLDDAETGAFTVVLVYRLDRLGRSLKSLLGAHEQLEAAGAAIRSGSEPFDTSTAFGRAMFQFLGIMAELERATIAERTSGGKHRVARLGKYVGGPVPLGYDVDAERFLVPSARIVEPLGITEAELVRDIFSRIADGGTTLTAECGRLSALGIPAVQRYGKNRKKDGTARVIERKGGWSYSMLQSMMHNPLYKGAGVLEAKSGDVERPGPALVNSGTWARAQAALTKNQVLSKKPDAKYEYLLRGLVSCAHCTRRFSGTVNGGRRQYRCNSNIGPLSVLKDQRCIAATVDATRLEDAVWNEVRELIAHPEEYVAKAQSELRSQLADASRNEAERRTLTRELAAKEQDRERVLDSFRRGWTTAAECERDLDKVAVEARAIRELLDGMRGRAEMASASEAYLAQVTSTLVQMQGELEDIELMDDTATKRRLIELLAPRMVIETELLGLAKVRERKRPTLRLTLAFRSEIASVAITRSSDGNYGNSCDQIEPLRFERVLSVAR